MATEKQIAYAKKLGIEDPESYTTQALSKLIDEKKGKTSQKAPIVAQNGSNQARSVSVQVVEKPHSFEFGPAGKRHKVYYDTVESLKAHIDDLLALGFAGITDVLVSQKIE